MKAARAPEASQPRLVLDGREWRLSEGEHVLGRDEDVAIRIDARGVSRRHARIVVRAGRSSLEDLDSKNGTFCGDDRVTSTRTLKDGDVIGLGRRVKVVFHQRVVDETESELPGIHGEGDAVFRREGELWRLVFEGQTARVTDQKGLPDLARLLARPGLEVHCLDLAERPAASAPPDKVVDERARREIEARVRELRVEIDEASARHDAGRAERAREELEGILEVLSGAFGLRGRARGLGSDAERARSAVTWRVRSAIRKISAVHPRLGRHLENAVRTGVFCAYVPETPIRWVL
jgi:hypothetical protein